MARKIFTQDQLRKKDIYLRWLIGIVDSPDTSMDRYSLLYDQLLSTEFTWDNSKRNGLYLDSNRAQDGLALRSEFCDDNPEFTLSDLSHILPTQTQCSVLEMMVAFASRIDEQIMWDSQEGDRAWLWFRYMLQSLDCSMYDNNNFSKLGVTRKINIFLRHQYKSNGRGGLFYLSGNPDDIIRYFEWIPNFKLAMNDLQLWEQMGIWTQLYSAGILH